MDPKQRAEYDRQAERDASAHIWESLEGKDPSKVSGFIAWLRYSDEGLGVQRAMGADEIIDAFESWMSSG